MDVWKDARSRFDGLPDGSLNLAFEAVDRHVSHGHGARVAFNFVAPDASVRVMTYAELSRLTNRFANVLEHLGVAAGDLVFSFAGRIPSVYVTALGSLKARAVFCPLFDSFGEEPARVRLSKGRGSLILTTAALYHRRIAPIHSSLDALRHVIVDGQTTPPDTLAFDELIDRAADAYQIGPTGPHTPSFVHFTSGTTGTPHGALHVHEAALALHATAASVLHLRPEDVFWCTADPGWVMGISYGLLAPLLHGATVVVDEGQFDPARWYQIIQDHRVTVLYTVPTAIRMLMKAGSRLARSFDLSSLRLIATAGETLNPEAVRWGRQAFGMDIHDSWWQTETGAIMLATAAEDDVVLGTIGRAVPGIEAAVARRLADGALEFIDEPNKVGELVIKTGWPSMFRGYIDDPERYERCFAQGWYLSGDLVSRDSQGRFSFVSRDNEVIKSAGHLIGPPEVESCLLEHSAVAEAGAIGKPDALIGETVKVFVTLKDGVVADEDLRLDLLGFARKRLGPALAPREITFCRSLPKTRSGKIVRRLLRDRDLGLPEQDTSDLDLSTEESRK
jgi:acetyl-CoA synthetase